MTNSCQIFMLSAVQQRLFSAAEIIKQTFIKHFKIQQQQSNYLFRIYVYAENYAELTQLNSLLWGDKSNNRNEVLQFYPHYLMTDLQTNEANQIFYETLIFYTPIVLSSNYPDLIKIDDFLGNYHKNHKNQKNQANKIENIVIFISDDRQEILPQANNIGDYFDFGRFSSLVDIVYTSPVAVKNGRIRYRKYQQKNLEIKHLAWNR